MKKFPFISSPKNHGDIDTFTTAEIVAYLIIAVMVIVSLDLLFYPSTLDDAYITFRYAKHLAEGYGFGAWNIQGERVEGYTSFLWMVILGAAQYLGLDIRSASKILGIFFHVILSTTLIGFPLISRPIKKDVQDIFANPNEPIFAGIFLALYLPLCWYATTGMETVFFAALAGLTFLSIFLRHEKFLLPFFSILLVLTRPEGIVIASAAVFLDFLIRRRENRKMTGVYISMGAVIVTFGALLLQREILFGDIVPNTYWAKAGGASFHHAWWGLQYVYEWMFNHYIVVILCITGVVTGLWKQRKLFIETKFNKGPLGLGVITGLLAAFTLYIIKVGGDNNYAFPFWRHFVQLSAPIAFLLSYAITHIFFSKSRHVQLGVTLGVVLLTNLSILGVSDARMFKSIQESLPSYPNLSHAAYGNYLIQLKQICQVNTVVASSLGGELPYYVDATHIDILGLNTRYIAKYGSFDPAGPPDSKTDMKWVMEQHPDILEGYLPGTLILNSTPEEIKQYINTNWRFKMLTEMVSSPIFQQDYLFVRNWDYQDLDRALFIKRSYIESHQLQNKLDCVPIADTPLSIYKK